MNGDIVTIISLWLMAHFSEIVCNILSEVPWIEVASSWHLWVKSNIIFFLGHIANYQLCAYPYFLDLIMLVFFQSKKKSPRMRSNFCHLLRCASVYIWTCLRVTQWFEKQNDPLCFLICWNMADAAYAKVRWARPSDSCCFEGEKIRNLVCVEIWLDRVVGALKCLQGSHTCKR